MKKITTSLLLLFLGSYLLAQNSENRTSSFQQYQKLKENSFFKNVPFRNVGPTVMSGRVVDIEANPTQPNEIYSAFASGGLWYSTTAGVQFTPLFQNEASMTIGDIAVQWKEGENTIYIGSGENNSSRSSYSGNGIYKSSDNGKSWTHIGLENTQHIGRIVLDPSNENNIWVASIGNLYSKDINRGIYKSTDGGASWKQTLFISDSTGVIDLVIDSKDSNILYASAWERHREAWNFKASGKESGIFKSTDGGTTWNKISIENSGFPTGEGVGRIGLSISKQNSNKIYAFLDNQDNKKEITKKTISLHFDQLKSMSDQDFLTLDENDINAYLDHYNFPNQYNATSIKEDIKNKKYSPKALVDYLGDAEEDLFNTQVKGAEVYVSEDGGKNWTKTHDNYLDRVVYTFGYYFGNIRVDPTNDNQIYILGVPFLGSSDGGKTWNDLGNDNVHVDHHALWINPNNPQHFILGNDGGVNITYDGGKNYLKCNSFPVGQFYSVNYDMAEPYNIYGGLQDNGVWVGSSNAEINSEWQNNGKYPFQSVMGGDGMQIGVDERDNTTIYTGYQFGNYYKINQKTNKMAYITPKHTLSEKPLRWNWQSPIVVSKHNYDVIYFGSNRLHRSLDQGDNFVAVSDDLTHGGIKGNVPYGTLTSISESPLQFGLIYTGSDDGMIQLSENVGATWTNISSDLPKGLWVSRVIASKYNAERVYISLNGYRFDDFNSYLYVSDDKGQNWKKLGNDLPAECINVVKEDPSNENILYVGTDHGLYISFDKGNSFMVFGDLPRVAIHDLAIQPRENEIIVGTHGRSIYVGKLADIQSLNQKSFHTEITTYPLSNVTLNKKWGQIEGYFEWGVPIESSIKIPVFTNASGELSMQITLKDKVLFENKYNVDKGLNYIDYNFTIDSSNKKTYEKVYQKKYILQEKQNGKYYLDEGEYEIKFTKGDQSMIEKLIIKAPQKKQGRVKKKKIP
ncbi:WD40/YVTN/BNR-like repeat-containing protein [Flammeovirga pacifica]|uniref:Glycosyl hydrolase n=1 Tax=Flammeovirga pacifica TaxID=915059 RepID=A0A1S1YWR6_FLAPC|nr:exo-alpha-sialidase [Flammeovirga pacifica]OHX65466.1 glycosyl hydrolase [Flammeovirga pacifica]